jgi:bacterial/archaeal transporter family-2 protein
MGYLALAFVIGCAIPLQAAINSQLKGHLDQSTILAALVSFTVGTIALAIVAVVSGQRIGALAQVTDARAWQLTGGLLGALFVFGTTLLAPQIGVARMTALILAGQVLVSLLMDTGGWLGLPVRELTLTRVAGAVLVVAGVVLVNFDQLVRK